MLHSSAANNGESMSLATFSSKEISPAALRPQGSLEVYLSPLFS